MAPIPEQNLTTQAIYKHYLTNNPDYRRNHLGASLIGSPCDRAIWYSFHWCQDPRFNGRMIRLFETGNREEKRIISNLRTIGVELYDVDPKSGRQIHYESFRGHFSGSLDGIGRGFPEAPKTWHVLECKTMSTKNFLALQKSGSVEKTKPEHYCQMQTYMGWSGLDRAMYMVVCKDTDEIYQERVYFNKEVFQRLVERAKYIIFSEVPPAGISDNATFYKCKWCEFNEICHKVDMKLPEVSCRTCAFVTPRSCGRWSCDRIGKVLDQAEQHAGCDWHCFIPELVCLECVDANPGDWTISYKVGEKVVVNGLTPPGVPSRILEEVVREMEK
jgi:hypothetical protein